MRYLLLSVLVVCVIGVMVPSVFAEEPCYGGPLENIPPGGLPCGGPGYSVGTPLTAEERCIKNNECMIKVTTDKQIYQSDETINITVELIGMDYFGVEYLHYNPLPVFLLYSMKYENSRLTNNGALLFLTGKNTGRAPDAKKEPPCTTKKAHAGCKELHPG